MFLSRAARAVVAKTAAIAATTAALAIAPPVRSGQLPDGTVFFESAVELEAATSYEDRVGIPGGRVFFTVAVPEDAREPLASLAIEQVEGFDRGWRFDLDATRAQRQDLAELADRDREAIDVGVSTIAADERHLDRLEVQFDEPIAPGQRVTVRLRLYYTPHTAGVYQWRVQAFPAGARSQPQTLGTARFHFTNRL